MTDRNKLLGVFALCAVCTAPVTYAAEPADSAAASATPAQAPETQGASPAPLVTAPSAPVPTPKMDAAQMARRMGSVSTLLEKSSAARQIESSGSADALALRDKARALYEQAKQAYQAGDVNKASKLLNEATKTMFQGVRLAAPQQVTGEKALHDFEARMASVKALMEAQERIAKEKHEDANTVDLHAKVQAKIKEASDLAAAGKLDQASGALDQAYALAKVSIENMRRGDTLVRSLHFATKEEEYRYEVDRNNTHQMLIKMLLEEKKDMPSVVAMAQKFVDQAMVLRKQAEAVAAKGDYEGGIKLLEDSTKQLIRAIRSAGIYIPG